MVLDVSASPLGNRHPLGSEAYPVRSAGLRLEEVVDVRLGQNAATHDKLMHVRVGRWPCARGMDKDPEGDEVFPGLRGENMRNVSQTATGRHGSPSALLPLTT